MSCGDFFPDILVNGDVVNAQTQNLEPFWDF